ncbi:hypothetical protein [Mycobacterium sp.]|uniref:hypothetical protein n=1 Tax=Mycobacterium sp. TaxID=1785 RepID=UPI003C72F9D9
MKFSLKGVRKRVQERERRPSHLFGGRVRISTVVLIVAFLAVSWVYNTYRPHEPSRGNTPTTQVVPPGFVPDPNYTWVPRTRVDQRPSTTVPQTPTTTETPTPTTTTTSPPPLPLPTLPCLIPALCPSSTTAPSAPSSPVQQPPPGPGPVPTSAPAAG